MLNRCVLAARARVVGCTRGGGGCGRTRLQHGLGVATYRLGGVYRGEWAKGLRAGHGTYLYSATWASETLEEFVGAWAADTVRGCVPRGTWTSRGGRVCGKQGGVIGVLEVRCGEGPGESRRSRARMNARIRADAVRATAAAAVMEIKAERGAAFLSVRRCRLRPAMPLPLPLFHSCEAVLRSCSCTRGLTCTASQARPLARARAHGASCFHGCSPVRPWLTTLLSSAREHRSPPASLSCFSLSLRHTHYIYIYIYIYNNHLFFSCRYGLMTWRNGDHYLGQLEDGRPHGAGTWRSGSRRTIRGRDVGDRRDKRRLVAYSRLVRGGGWGGGHRCWESRGGNGGVDGE